MGAPSVGSDPSALEAEAKSLADIGEFDRARETIKRAIDHTPNDPELHARMAWYTFRCSGIEAHERERLAEHHIGLSFELKADNPHAHFYRASIWIAEGNAARAKGALESALRADPRFAAAREALDRLGGGGAAVAAQPVAAPHAPHAAKRRVVRTSIVALTTAALLVGAVGYFLLSADDRELAHLAKQLGTKLTLQSANKAEQELRIDVGASWTTLSPDEHAREVQTMGDRARALGFPHLFVYSNTRPVAESHEGKACADATCMAMPVFETGPGGPRSLTNLPKTPGDPARPEGPR
jgi:tetratricopeptide (TPR) repeat protein